MNRIAIRVVRPTAALKAFAETARAAAAGGAMRPWLAFGSLRELFSAITWKRLELLCHVAVHEGLNVKQLAQSLGRDCENVHADVRRRADLGRLERDTDGGAVHAVLRDRHRRGNP
jgi:predicted transcriptional regulator